MQLLCFRRSRLSFQTARFFNFFCFSSDPDPDESIVCEADLRQWEQAPEARATSTSEHGCAQCGAGLASDPLRAEGGRPYERADEARA